MSWLNSALPSIADAATYGLAALGGFMTLKPPTQEQQVLNAVYLVSILLLAATGIMANAKQRVIEQAKQDKLQQNETDARNQFPSDLKDVKTSNGTILSLVTHPPKGFTQGQVASMARLFLTQQQENSKAASDSLLRAMAPGIVGEMRSWVPNEPVSRMEK